MKTLFHFHLCNLLIPFPLFFVLGWKSHTLRRLIFKGIHFCNINFRVDLFSRMQIWPYFACIFKIWNCTNIQLRKNFAEKHFRGFFKYLKNPRKLIHMKFYLVPSRYSIQYDLIGNRKKNLENAQDKNNYI